MFALLALFSHEECRADKFKEPGLFKNLLHLRMYNMPGFKKHIMTISWRGIMGTGFTAYGILQLRGKKVVKYLKTNPCSNSDSLVYQYVGDNLYTILFPNVFLYLDCFLILPCNMSSKKVCMC